MRETPDLQRRAHHEEDGDVGDERDDVPKPVDLTGEAQRNPRSLEIAQPDPRGDRCEDAGEFQLVGAKIAAVRAQEGSSDLQGNVGRCRAAAAAVSQAKPMPSSTPPADLNSDDVAVAIEAALAAPKASATSTAR